MRQQLRILLVASRRDPYSRRLFEGVARGCKEVGSVELWNLPITEDVNELRDYLIENEMSGVLLRGAPQEVVDALAEAKVPHVVMRATETTTTRSYAAIHPVDEQIVRIAAEEFRRLGLKNWGYLGLRGLPWSNARRDCLAALHDGVSVLEISATEGERWGAVREIQDWLVQLDKPCGILAANDEAAFDLLHAARQAEISVPSEIAVLGIDNDQRLCEAATPPLSSIDLHAEEVGRAAALELARVLGLEVEAEIRVPNLDSANLVIRESSHRVDHYLRLYQRAQNYLWGHRARCFSVGELAAGCNTSRRALERAFATHSSASPADLVRRSRIGVVTVLLRRGGLTQEEVAHQTGFTSASGLANFVQRQTGKTPVELARG